MTDMTGKKVLALASQGLEQIEFTSPRDALTEAGAEAFNAALLEKLSA